MSIVDDDAHDLAGKLGDAGLEYTEALQWIRNIQAGAIRDASRAMPIYGKRGEPRMFDSDGDGDVVDFLLDYANQIENSEKPVDSRRRRSVT